ncbi:hypothetical protein [Deinococcus sp.]|uniref:3D domain-containing protein n=1 Tax=Deinococcus sp. TaxID=47478 RepID=UPI0025C11C40|nr:hypothetical protein [Deinococcus sp.]
MLKNIKSLIQGIVIASTAFASGSFASALPALPASNMISSAVQTALNVAPTPQQGAAQQLMQDTLAQSSRARSVIAHATAYNSFGGQTDGSPSITATGTRTRPGVVALSRDLLRVFPYGSRVQLQDLSGNYNFGNRVFVVEDTMAARKVGSIDVWMPSYSQAISFGGRTVRVTAVR